MLALNMEDVDSTPSIPYDFLNLARNERMSQEYALIITGCDSQKKEQGQMKFFKKLQLKLIKYVCLLFFLGGGVGEGQFT